MCDFLHQSLSEMVEAAAAAEEVGSAAADWQSLSAPCSCTPPQLSNQLLKNTYSSQMLNRGQMRYNFDPK